MVRVWKVSSKFSLCRSHSFLDMEGSHETILNQVTLGCKLVTVPESGAVGVWAGIEKQVEESVMDFREYRVLVERGSIIMMHAESALKTSTK